MAVTTKLAAPNSVVLVSDAAGGEIPSSMQGSIIAATRSCIAIGCIGEDDGETELTLGGLADLDRKDEPAYEGPLMTPSYRVIVRSVLGKRLLEYPVSGEVTTVKIWINDASEPDEVVVAVG